MCKKWLSISATYFYGLVGTCALGMMGPLTADICKEFGVTASSVGIALAGQLLPLAFAGLIMGRLIDRFGARPLMLLGLLLMGACSVVNFLGEGFNSLRITLLFEGTALVAILTSGQSLLMVFTSGKLQIQALTLWSTVMPVGYALGLLVVSPVAGGGQWKDAFLAHAIVVTIAAIAFPLIPAVRTTASEGGILSVLRNYRVLRFGISLSLSALAGIGSSAVGAIYFNQIHGVEIDTAARWMALASLCGVIGSALIGALLTKGWSGSLLSLLIFCCAVFGAAAFYWPGSESYLALSGAILLQLCVGGFIALAFSLLPHALSDPGQSGAAAGLVGQITGIGAAFSAPLFFAMLDGGQWYLFVLAVFLAWGASSLIFPAHWRRSETAVA